MYCFINNPALRGMCICIESSSRLWLLSFLAEQIVAKGDRGFSYFTRFLIMSHPLEGAISLRLLF